MEQNDSHYAHQPPLLTPANPALPAFAPVLVRARHDGWSPDRQLEFIEALACTLMGGSANLFQHDLQHVGVEDDDDYCANPVLGGYMPSTSSTSSCAKAVQVCRTIP
jgi:hypothetical protein